MPQSAVVGLLRVLLTANTAEFTSAMKSVQDSAKTTQRTLRDVGRQASDVGSALTKTFTLPLVAGFAASAKAAMDFESSFAGVRKTLNATEPELAAISQELRNLSKTIPVNVNELNALAEAAGAMGIAKGDVVEFTRVMALLGVTTNVTSEQAAESIGKMQNIFGAAGKDTDRFAATLVALGNDGASTESQILEMATRIAAAGNTIGLTQGQVLGFASALSSVGLEAEAGGTAISRVFVDMQAAVSQGGKALDGFTKLVPNFATLFKTDAAGAVNAFITALGNVKASGGDLLKTLAELGFTEVRVRDTLLRAAGAGDLVTRSLQLQKTAWEQNTALTEEARKRFETTESKLALLWNRVKDVGITLGNALLPAINSVIGAADKLLPLIDTLAKAFGALPGPVQATAIGLAAVAAAVGPLRLVLGSLARSASDVIGLFAKKSAASKLLGGALDGVRTRAVTTAGAFGRLGTAARASGLLVGGLSAALVGIAVPIALELIERRMEAIRQEADALIAASKLTGRKVTSPTEAARLVGAQQAGAAGLPITQAVPAGTIPTAEEAQVWETARTAAHGYGTEITQVTIKQTEQGAVTNTNTGLTIAGALALTQMSGAAKAYTGGVVTLGQAVGAATKPVSALTLAQQELAAANAKYAADVTKGGEALRFEVLHMAETGKKAEELASKYGVAESSVERLKASLAKNAKELEKSSSWMEKFRDNATQLEAKLKAAEAAGVPMTIMLEEFGTEIEHVVNRAPLLGEAVAAATGRAAAALKAADLDKAVKELLTDAGKEARALADDIIEAQADIAQKGLEAANAGFLAGLESQAGALREGLKLQEDAQADSLETRLGTIHHHYELQRIELRNRAGDHTEALKIIEDNERIAAENATRAWEQHVADVRSSMVTYSSIFTDALKGVPGAIASALQGGGGLKGGVASIFSGLGGSLGGKLFGDMAQKLSGSLFKMFGQNITSMLGTMLPGIGTAIGAFAGPLIEKLFSIGGPSKEELAGRDVVKSFESQLASSLTATQKLAAGNEPWKLTTIAVRDAYLAAGKTAAEAEAAVKKLWDSSTQGAEASELAVLEIQAVMDQAAEKQKGLAAGTEAASTAQQDAIDKVKAKLDGLTQEYDQLYESIKDEAPEEVMGIVEQQTRARMEAIDKERKNTEDELKKLTEGITGGFQTAGKGVDAFKDKLDDAIRDREMTVRVNYVSAGEPTTQASTYAQGGFVRAFGQGGMVPQYFPIGGLVKFQPRGTDVVPAMLTPGELVLNAAQQRNVAAALRAVSSRDLLTRQAVEAVQSSRGRETGGRVVIQRGAFDGVFRGAVIDSPERVEQIVDRTIALLKKGGARQTRFRRAVGVPS